MKVWLVISILFFSCNSLAKCEDQGFRQFDFWLGDWSVTSVGGLESGRNRITREYDGCVIKESYTTELGYRGESINIYDASTHRWHQTWVDNSGLLLRLDGEFHEGKMVLQGDRKNAAGIKVTDKITWTANPDGTVRQVWLSKQGAEKWQIVFDGLYKKETEK
ncbi:MULTISPECIES: hypothetical protein [Pseudoalteromonas]|jgi:hypothetical protein|uniref:hypothetical protein n=1 Tax=Pseudoalteromonas TaxID=53246 RepID=UPI000C7D2684|nr:MULTISPECIES: hypothetical protein [Pseudoalteromonas]AUJ70777.1 hypothetical protein PNC201_12560 [Pseudoalteromonas sp. NC201]MBR8845268.1 hypothetical protein [Pseudoalteromonas sp. JC3]NSY34376.1 hypothetical protein [Pseudoalteromonas sp. JC28]UDM60994.1 hypothetical protein KIJ96_14410 [Pseudoalteromonas piscicida]WJE07859.1 hypothetical protein QSH61_13305 [Pseudoalteromonas sp. JC3]